MRPCVAWIKKKLKKTEDFTNNLSLSCIFRVNLYELIKKNNFQGFSLALIRRFTHALLRCLQMLHREKIIHCDLKPVHTSLSAVIFGRPGSQMKAL